MVFPVSNRQPHFRSDPPEIVLGNFNRDGKSDLALIDGYSNNIYVQPGNADGTFQAGISVPLQSSPEQLIAADFNKDGELDLAVACPFMPVEYPHIRRPR